MEEKEQTNKHGLGSAPSARKGVLDTLHSPCICRLSRAYISTKATRNTNSSLTVFLHCLLLLTVLPLDCYLKPTVLLCSPLSTDSLRLPLSTQPLCLPWDLLSLLHFQSRGRSRPQSFVWVSRQSRQRDSLTGAHTHTQHNEWPHSVTIELLDI